MRCEFQLAYKGSALAPNAHVAPRRTHIHNCKCCLPVVGLPIRCFFFLLLLVFFFLLILFILFTRCLLHTHSLVLAIECVLAAVIHRTGLPVFAQRFFTHTMWALSAFASITMLSFRSVTAFTTVVRLLADLLLLLPSSTIASVPFPHIVLLLLYDACA